jgi:hypothetical protein
MSKGGSGLWSAAIHRRCIKGGGIRLLLGARRFRMQRSFQGDPSIPDGDACAQNVQFKQHFVVRELATSGVLQLPEFFRTDIGPGCDL